MSGRFWLAAAMTAGMLACATPATAQRVWQNGRWLVLPPPGAPTVMPTRTQRWPMVNGRWSAGWEAPGGWNAYRRLGRGASLPGYWMRHRIPDYLSFGLAAPPRGYFWVRYYDDAVLVDDGGRVWDSVGGIGWAGASAYASGGGGGSFSTSESYSNVSVSYPQRRPIQHVDPNPYHGAPPIRQDGPDYGYDDGYADPIPLPSPYPGGYAPPAAPLPPAVQSYPAPCYQGCTGYGGGYHGGAYQAGGYYGGGYGYAAGATTTIVITMPAPVVTTTTVVEEVIEESSASYSGARTKLLPRKPMRHRPRYGCNC